VGIYTLHANIEFEECIMRPELLREVSLFDDYSIPFPKTSTVETDFGYFGIVFRVHLDNLRDFVFLRN